MGYICVCPRAAATLVFCLAVLPVPSALGHLQWPEQCRQVVLDYAYHRDRQDGEAVAALFTPDATFVLGNDAFSGRAAIRDRVDAGKGGPVFRHMMSTTHLRAEGAERASGVSYAAIYAGGAGALPQVASEFLALGEYVDEFVRVDDRCMISRRTFVRVLVPEAAPADGQGAVATPAPDS